MSCSQIVRARFFTELLLLLLPLLLLLLTYESLDDVVGLLMKLRPRKSTKHRSIPGHGTILFHLTPYPGLLWGTRKLLLKGYQGSVAKDKAAGG